MDKDIALALKHVLQRFNGMEFDTQTLEFLDMEVNDMLNRLFPEFSIQFHVTSKYFAQKKTIKFNPVRKQ